MGENPPFIEEGIFWCRSRDLETTRSVINLGNPICSLMADCYILQLCFVWILLLCSVALGVIGERIDESTTNLSLLLQFLQLSSFLCRK